MMTELPRQSELWRGKTVQATASSSSDRGSCEVLFPSHCERGQGQGQPFFFPNNVST